MVHGWYDSSCVNQHLTMARSKVADADALRLAAFSQLDHALPGVNQAKPFIEKHDIVLLRLKRYASSRGRVGHSCKVGRPMDEIQVDVIGSKVFQSLVECLL